MPKVRVYTAEWCPYCHMVADFLKKNKVKFEEIDVDKVPGAAEELIEKSGQSGIPVVDIDGKMIVGFDKGALKKALKLK